MRSASKLSLNSVTLFPHVILFQSMEKKKNRKLPNSSHNSVIILMTKLDKNIPIKKTRTLAINKN